MSSGDTLQFCFRVESLPERYPDIDIEAVFQHVVTMYIQRKPFSEMQRLPYPPKLITEVYDLLVQALRGRNDDQAGGAGVPAKLGPKPPGWAVARIERPRA